MGIESQVLLSVALPTIAVLVGMLINNRQLEALRSEMNARFEEMNARFEAMNARLDAFIDTMNARFDSGHQALLHLEGVMDARLRHI